jgi:uncharacterized protein
MSKTKTIGRFLWQELITTDTKTALAFYGELFGWKAQTMDMGPGGTYTILKSGDKDIAGALSDERAKGLPPQWNVYFSTPDTDKTVEDAKKAGAKVMSPAWDIPNIGRCAVLIDPQGASFSLLQSVEERAETEGKPAPGEFCWVEGIVDDPAAALAFYGKLFGWTSKETPMGDHGAYHHLSRAGDKPAGGIVKKSMPGPNAWLSYVAVDDIDAAVKRAARLRGTVLLPATAVKGIGTFAVLKDPTGAVFAVFKGE